MKIRLFIVAASILLAFPACNPEQDLPETDGVQLIDETHGSGTSYAARTLCETVRGATLAGVYRVGQMYSVLEELPNGAKMPFTYVPMTLVDPWSPDPPEEIMGRIWGGKVDGQSVSWAISIKSHQGYGMILDGPHNGYYIPGEPTLFNRDEDGHYRSATFFHSHDVDSEEARRIVRLLWDTEGECAHDESIEDYLPHRETQTEPTDETELEPADDDEPA